MSTVAVKEIKFVKRMVTPGLAAEYLAFSGGNRKLSRWVIEMYKRDLLAGRWHLTHQGIAFDTTGALRDGHHRLTAIAESGVSAALMVAYDVPADGLQYVDSGRIRSPRDRIFMSGNGVYSNEFLAVIRSLWRLPSHGTPHPSNDELHTAIELAGDCVAYACDELPGSRPGLSRGVRVVVARAWFHAERERLSEFCAILRTGIPVNPHKDSAALKYRDTLIGKGARGGAMAEIERYRKGQSALSYFLRGEEVASLRGSQLDLFPMPDSIPCPFEPSA